MIYSGNHFIFFNIYLNYGITVLPVVNSSLNLPVLYFFHSKEVEWWSFGEYIVHEEFGLATKDGCPEGISNIPKIQENFYFFLKYSHWRAILALAAPTQNSSRFFIN